MSTTKTCTTCGHPVDKPYTNEAAGERCNDPSHTALCNCNALENVTHTMGITGCAYADETRITADDRRAAGWETDKERATRWNDDVTVTVTLEVAEALCRAAEFLVEPNPVGPGTVWVSDETGDVFATTDEALVKALPRIAEIGTFWRADNEEMAEAARTVREGDLEAAREAEQTQAEVTDGARAFAQGDNFTEPHDSDRENGPNAGDAEQDYLDHVRKMEERADNRPAVGAKVLFIDAVDRYPHFTVPAGATGTVTNSDDDYYAVKVDQPIAGAEEWDNEVIWSIGDDEEPAMDVRLTDSFVNHEALEAMSYDELGDAIEEGGPSDLINALLAERRERHRKVDSIYRGDWDEDGTISLSFPAIDFGPWLEDRGWTRMAGGWRSPIGDMFWHVDEALQRQLLTEALR